jgi:hypothetical protein
MRPEDKMAIKFPESMTSFVPREATEISPLWIWAPTNQPMTARAKPLQAARTAPVPDAFSQVIMFQRGTTADPITIPMKR